MAQQILCTNTFTTAKWIVSATASDGTHTTIATALTSASSGDTIAIRPGTYTENLTLKAGITITSLGPSGSVTIVGKMVGTFNGTVIFNNITFQTNSDNIAAISGAANSVNLVFNTCGFNCTTSTGLVYTTTGASASATFFNCTGDLSTTGIALFTGSAAGNDFIFNNSKFTNTGNSTTANTCGSSIFRSQYTTFQNPINPTAMTTFKMIHSEIDCGAINTAAITTATSGTHLLKHCNFLSGTASALSIATSTTANLDLCDVNSSNTNAITGAGTINYAGITFSGSSTTINTTTQTTVGTLQGSKNTAPAAGFLGERISSYAANQSAGISNSQSNVTSISLTAGIWDLSFGGLMVLTGAATLAAFGISATSATITGNNGDQVNYLAFVGTAWQIPISLSGFRVILTTTTTYYLVQTATFSTGTAAGYGRITALRVG